MAQKVQGNFPRSKVFLVGYFMIRPWSRRAKKCELTPFFFFNLSL